MGNANTHDMQNEEIKTYAIRVTRRVTREDKHKTEHLDYICPDGVPVWTPNSTYYASHIPTFETAQRLCRQMFVSPQFPVGCKVQFIEQKYHPEYSANGVYMKKISDRKLSRATIIKPIMDSRQETPLDRSEER
jgi:hypothetical protein